MSLVDAIRQAAARQTTPGYTTTPAPMPSPVESFQTPVEPPVDVDIRLASHIENTPTASHGVMRLELLLSPEQLHELLRGLLNGAHAVFTLREASHYLRMTTSALTAFAESGQVPAFMIENKWRFSKAALDEWMGQHGRIAQAQAEINTEAKNAD
ncbi:MAG: helix-turn-helix domain-containing protein [bacterium]|jgi:excisionase family DNA binding protein